MQIKRQIQNRKKVFKTWIATNLLIFIIPIIVGEFVYYNSINIIKHEVESVHLASLQQFKILVDGKMGELKKIGNALAIDPKIKTLSNSRELYTPQNLYTMGNIQKDLKKYIVSNSFVENIYLYFSHGGCLLTDNGIYTGSEIKLFIEDAFMTGLEEWQKQIQQVNPGNIRISKKDSGTGARNSVVLFQSLTPNIYSKSPGVTMMIAINAEKLSDVMSSLDTESKANISILNNLNEDLKLYGGDDFPFVNYKDLKAYNSVFNISNKNQDITVTHVGSEIINLEYILSMPSSVFAYKIRYIKTVVYFYIGVCVVLGAIVIYLVAKKNYDPLRRLTQISSKNASLFKQSGMNEYKVIENAINSLITDKENAETRIRNQDIPLRKNFLMRMLKGSIRDKTRMENLQKIYKIDFESNNFIVITFEIENPESILLNNSENPDEENTELVYFIIQNITEELIGDKYIRYFTEIDGMSVCLINYKHGMDDADVDSGYNAVAEAAQNSIKLIQEHFDIQLSAAVSDIKKDFDGIPAAYSETLEILEYKRLMEKSNIVIKYGSIEQSKADETENINTMKNEICFMNYLLDNDFKNASLMLDSIMELYLPSHTANFQVVKCRMFGLINIMLNAIGEFKSKADMDYFNKLDPMTRMINSKSGTELKKQIKLIFKSIVEYSDNNQSKEAQSKITEIIDYINHHYSDQNLNVSAIAVKYEMNVSYLSRIFKKRTGISILDYIHKQRIENAKLMLSTGLSIAEISEKAGYTSSLALIRTFKKYEGITPGKYRENMKLQQ
ncbi:AraC-like DNA-binding protein [Anaerobacterium chartisolvens]|uniref:AraC-like DNA-binding protein n=1 Tax=Anaerobacterium chartisolvens TaxID=1297424 RepID=A0A369BD66_9FIRM|nr:AraC family transcriptional regulator [Anaerobacterium chartisolvens]RCX19483.1 AraC-like DNA-binding protein [Anaerobacterium chartisolvens]